MRPAPLPDAGSWTGPSAGSWRSSLDADGYRARVGAIRRFIEAGQVYQVNLCRMLDAPLPPGADPAALAAVLAAGNPAPYQGVLHTGEDWVVCASPELFLAVDGDRVVSAPIKGTAAADLPFADKDTAENVMITDLVRNDLNRVCTPESVRVDALLATEPHPGLRHLVSTVSGRLRPGVGWGEILAATFPPGSVSGAPKLAALDVIRELEPVPRGPYCGAVGMVDADRGRAGPGRRHPLLLHGHRRRGQPTTAVRHRGRHHLPLRPGRRVGRDRAEGRQADRAGVRAAVTPGVCHRWSRGRHITFRVHGRGAMAG